MNLRTSLKITLVGLASSACVIAGTPSAAIADTKSARIERAVQFALAQQGDRYVYGATGPNAWDCSSLTQRAYRSVGRYIPRTSASQRYAGPRVSIRNLRRGDLVFYPGHVAMYLGHGRQVAATKPSTGVRVQNVYRGAQYGVRVIP